MFSYVLFDFDGTVADTKKGIIKAADYALKKFGINETKENLHRFVGPSLWYSFPTYYNMDDKTAAEAVGYYREYYSVKGIYEAELYSGMPELLNSLKQQGIKTGIASAKVESSVRNALEYFGALKYFDCVIGSAPDGSNSEKDMLISKLLEEMNIKDKEYTVYIGDSKTDSQGAKCCSLKFIAAVYDRNKSEFAGYPVDYYAEKVEDLYGYITK